MAPGRDAERVTEVDARLANAVLFGALGTMEARLEKGEGGQTQS